MELRIWEIDYLGIGAIDMDGRLHNEFYDPEMVLSLVCHWK